MAKRAGLRLTDIHQLVDALFGGDLHAKRVASLANATLGVITSASLAVHAIGQGLAQARGTLTKHGVKQVDRLLSNGGVGVVGAMGALLGGSAHAQGGGDGLDGL